MNKIQIRPRFTIETKMPKDEVIQSIRDEVKNCNGKCEVNQLKNLILFKIPEEMQHFWSPELSIEINKSNDNTILNCVLGPKPAIWTMFTAFYGFSIFIGLVGLILGFSQWSIGKSPYGFLLVLISAFMILGAYLIAITGQKLSYNEMIFLRSKIKRAIEENA